MISEEVRQEVRQRLRAAECEHHTKLFRAVLKETWG
jgi:hypothetical protein